MRKRTLADVTVVRHLLNNARFVLWLLWIDKDCVRTLLKNTQDMNRMWCIGSDSRTHCLLNTEIHSEHKSVWHNRRRDVFIHYRKLALAGFNVLWIVQFSWANNFCGFHEGSNSLTLLPTKWCLSAQVMKEYIIAMNFWTQLKRHLCSIYENWCRWKECHLQYFNGSRNVHIFKNKTSTRLNFNVMYIYWKTAIAGSTVVHR